MRVRPLSGCVGAQRSSEGREEKSEDKKEEDGKEQEGLIGDGLSQGEAAEEEGEEGREPVRLRAPHRVSREEREAHEATHTPYRAWCKHCVRARGRNQQHKRQNEDEKKKDAVPRMSMDYFFMSKEDEQASKNPLIVMVDEETGEKYARAVGRKGMGDNGEMDWLIKDMSEELKVWGHAGGEGGHIVLKSDGERRQSRR